MSRLLPATLLLALLLTGSLVRAQSLTYNQLLEGAARQLGQKNYCAATAAFTQAFADSSRVGPFDLYAGAGAAANCPGQQAQALRWLLQLSRQPNLPITARDIDQMAQDASLSSLHSSADWNRFLVSMRQTAARRVAEAQRAAAEWQQAALGQALPAPTKPGAFAVAQPGFALYYAPVDTVRVPYLVYVPKTYNLTRPAALLVYLHGALLARRSFGPLTRGWRRSRFLPRQPSRMPWCSTPSAGSRLGG
ncbi:hypothetical protein [Hymenobacter cellulosilyticus]|uniref:Uncharacterized protein n=1 Tax=Hymenobacter cellulosilyticus TaxID=2932248 RepID=A0A8T9Q4R5_9BACT|nr:hypothetical protein [Hymenobacter cellulosilyticus]UOQ70469.1 hypothetical protein MUN79_17235 [Hymenobacter cellulosilyticus]